MHAAARFRTLMTVLLVVLVWPVGCHVKSAIRSSGGATFGSREVKFALDGSGGITATNDTATVRCSAGSILIEKHRVLLNGKELAKIPENAKLITVDHTAGTLTITADGTVVHQGKPGP